MIACARLHPRLGVNFCCIGPYEWCLTPSHPLPKDTDNFFFFFVFVLQLLSSQNFNNSNKNGSLPILFAWLFLLLSFAVKQHSNSRGNGLIVHTTTVHSSSRLDVLRGLTISILLHKIVIRSSEKKYTYILYCYKHKQCVFQSSTSSHLNAPMASFKVHDFAISLLIHSTIK